MPSVAEWQAEAEAAKQKAPAKPDPAEARRKFRASMAWRRVRYKVLAANAAKNGGKARCELCGAAAEAGKPLHVDHILPVSTAAGWARRLDMNVLRVCCADCNIGRLNSPIEMEGRSIK
ncbi:MAG: HNH endonuclease [Acetobacteraceae bacterium]